MLRGDFLHIFKANVGKHQRNKAACYGSVKLTFKMTMTKRKLLLLISFKNMLRKQEAKRKKILENGKPNKGIDILLCYL